MTETRDIRLSLAQLEMLRKALNAYDDGTTPVTEDEPLAHLYQAVVEAVQFGLPGKLIDFVNP